MQRCLHLVSAALLALCLARPGWSEPPSAISPEQVGLSSARLGHLSDLLRSEVTGRRIGGAVVLVARHGKVAYFEPFGQADDGKPMQRDTLFRIASMTKPIVSVAALQLYEEGKLLLSDPVSKYIPEFADPRVLEILPRGSKPPYRLVPAKRDLTVHDLLRHTAGLPYRFVTDWYPDDPLYQTINTFYSEADIDLGLTPSDETAADLVKRLARLPLAGQPGEAFIYGHAADVLGHVVEVASGMPLDVYLRKRILDPLNMNDTYFFLPEDKVARLSAIWQTDGQGQLARIPDGVTHEGKFVFSPDYPYKGGRRFFGGGAGLVSSAPDYFRFCQMLLNHGELEGTRILSRKTVELMTATNHIGDLHADFLHSRGWKFGLGVAIEVDRGQDVDSGSIGTFEWAGIFSTRFSVDPKEEKITILLTQTQPFNYHVGLWDKVVNLSNAAIAD